ncbi:hypothetical protein [Arthrobacter sp. 18067]|uniref:hypothetical protein n=1 Tax=Arthrobacter sp. 18067 TaxID=2681413 RepID=UPI00135A8E67|nr:hypothetical protein [Arthrobacter sp. 18067]
MSKLELIGAVGVRVRPDAKGFRHDTKNQVERELKTYKPTINVTGEVEFNRAKARAEIRELERMAREAKVNVDVGFDAGRSKQVTQFVDQLRGSYGELSKAQRQAFLDRMRFAGFEEDSTRKSIDGFRRWQLQARSMLSINKQFRESLDSSGFTEIQKLADKLAGSNKQLSRMSQIVGSDLNGSFEKLNGQWARFSRAQRTSMQDILQADDNARIAQAGEELRRVNDQIDRLNEGKRRSTQAMYDSMFGNYRDNLTGMLKNDPWYQWSLGPKMDKVWEDLQHKAGVEAEKVRHEYEKRLDDLKAKVKAEPVGLGAVAAQLAYASRPRTANIFVKVNEKSLIVAEGMLKSLAGMNVLNETARTIERVFTKFDTFTLKAGGISAAIGSIVDSLAFATSGLLSIGEGVLNTVGLMAMAPTALAAVTATVLVTTAAFEDFKKAVDGDAKALAKLPANARAAATALKGTWESVQQPVQAAFWDGMGDSIQSFVDNTLPHFRDGLTKTAPHVASFYRGVLDSLEKVAGNGDLTRMFDNLALGFDNASGAAEPLTDAINRLGLRGSAYLPKFGTWLTEISTRFDNWIADADRLGNINRWIEKGTESLQDMWATGGAVVDIFKALTRAANDGGATGLDGLRSSLRNVADIMLAEPFQSRLSTIFDGARSGASELNTGVKDVGRSLGESAGWLSRLLQVSGDLGGSLLTGVARVIGNIKFQDGVLKGFSGLRDLVRDIGPSMGSIASSFGQLSGVAGAAFRGLAPLVNSVMGTIDDSVSAVSGNLERLAPQLTQFVTNRVEGLAGPVKAVFDGVNGILDVFNALPGPLGQAVLGIGAFLLLKNQIGGVFQKFDQGPLFSKLRDQWLEQGALAGKTVEQMGKFSATRVMFENATNTAGSFTKSLQTLNEQARVDGMSPLRANLNTTATVMRTGIMNAASGLMTLMGGPWGLALAGAGIALGAYGAAQAEAKQRVDALSASMDAQTGQATAQTLSLIAKSWTDIDKAGDGWANLTRGSKAANESAKILGLNLAEVTKSITNGGPAYDKLHSQLIGLKDALKLRADYGGFDEGTRRVQEFEGQLNLSRDALKNLNFSDVDHLVGNIEKSRNEAELAAAVYKGLGDATGTTGEAARQMAAAMQTIGDNSIDAAGKIGAIRKALELLQSGGKLSAREAQIAAADAAAAAVEQAKSMAESIAQAGDSIFNTTGLLSETSAVGRDLHKTMKSAADSILVEAQAAYDAATLAGKTPQVAADEALAIVSKNNTALNEIAKAAGIAPEALKKEWDTFFGKDWELRATFSATAQQFQEVMKAVQDAGYQFDGQEFSAWLLAQPDPAKVSIDEAKAHALNFAQGTYEAQLKALPQQAQLTIQQLTGTTQEQWNRGDFTAIMRAAKDVPGLSDALAKILAVKDGNYSASLQAFADAWALEQARKKLDDAAAPRKVSIWAQITGVDTSALDNIPPMIRRPSAENGAIHDGRTWSKKFAPGWTAFENGGISVEDPSYAKIYSAASQFRIFAEKATGGEAFIPLASSKRARSVEIWRETGRLLGQDVGVYENGGIAAERGVQRSRTGTTTVNIDRYIQQSDSGPDDVARALMRRAKREGLTAPLEGF